MTNTQLRAIRWTTLLIVLTFFRAAMADNSMNSFDLRDPQSPQALTAEQAIEKRFETANPYLSPHIRLHHDLVKHHPNPSIALQRY